MTKTVVPFAVPDVTEDEIQAVADAMRSGWLTTGPNAAAFEQEFAQYLGDGLQAVAVNSATAGMHLALEALGLGPGDEVLVPTWTFTATAEVVRYVGATPIFVDVEADTLNIDLSHAASLVTDRTRAVMPVHFAGRPVPGAKLSVFARSHGLRVVEDAAHAFPAIDDGRYVGAGDSDATVFSFYATKTITTGEGGMLITRDDSLAARARVMRLHGINRDVFDRYTTHKASWQYEVVAPGFKYNMTDVAAAIGRVQLVRAEQMRVKRAAIAEQYIEAFRSLPIQSPSLGPSGDHAHHLFVARIRDDAHLNRDDLIQHLSALGIGTSVHFIPLHLQPYWRDKYNLTSANYPQSSRIFPSVLSLPLFSSMTEAQVEHVIKSVRSAF